MKKRKNYNPTITDIYNRLLKAFKRRTGFHMSAKEVQTLCIMDGAISTVLGNIEFGYDNVDDCDDVFELTG